MGSTTQVRRGVTNWSVDDMAGSFEICELIGATRQQVTNWQERASSGFPEPLLRLRCGPVFSRTEVLEWWEWYQHTPKHVAAMERTAR
ncbi:hypothetical protein [Micromonospora maritima]|uniref:hypothetical protein n=1 Tax=Micromonospora maritima TaxID=986711 RepID=UPI00157D7977|nr:hypothetical protein [Micromonospora maritima]